MSPRAALCDTPTVLVHKGAPECCRATLLDFAKHDRYAGGGEPGDRVGCWCGNVLEFASTSSGTYLGWKVVES